MELVKMDEMVELFKERAKTVAARVSEAANAAEVEALIAKDRAEGEVGVAHAARGIASTGTCIVETDDEETRLETMLPETTVIVLKKSAIVPDLPDVADYMRKRQSDGAVTYTSFITGPSRTADIERVSAIGVHGPLAVHIILTED